MPKVTRQGSFWYPGGHCARWLVKSQPSEASVNAALHIAGGQMVLRTNPLEDLLHRLVERP
jgi:hypothetical protein